MKLTKQNLVNIIKEEIEAVVNEQMSGPDGFRSYE